MKSKIVAYLTMALLVLELLLVFVSWLLSATMTEGVRSLLSPEGVRWMLGHFADTVQSPVLVWLLLGAMAWGCASASRVVQAPLHRQTYSQRLALRVVVVLLLLYIVLLLWLSMVPHAVLLSVTGELWPSPFSHALIPLLALGTIVLSAVYGMLSHTFTTVSDITDALAHGIAQASPLLLIYIVAAQLYQSVCFVFL